MNELIDLGDEGDREREKEIERCCDFVPDMTSRKEGESAAGAERKMLATLLQPLGLRPFSILRPAASLEGEGVDRASSSLSPASVVVGWVSGDMIIIFSTLLSQVDRNLMIRL